MAAKPRRLTAADAKDVRERIAFLRAHGVADPVVEIRILGEYGSLRVTEGPDGTLDVREVYTDA